MAETVTIEVENWAVPQPIAPKGRWTFRLRGRGFEVDVPDYMPAYSPEGAVNAGKRLAARLKLKVGKINVETD
jgi:hypothetical protein